MTADRRDKALRNLLLARFGSDIHDYRPALMRPRFNRFALCGNRDWTPWMLASPRALVPPQDDLISHPDLESGYSRSPFRGMGSTAIISFWFILVLGWGLLGELTLQVRRGRWNREATFSEVDAGPAVVAAAQEAVMVSGASRARL